MRHTKALILSVAFTLLVSIGVIVFNNTYASPDASPPATASQASADQQVVDLFDRLVGPGDDTDPAGYDDDEDRDEDEAWDDDGHDDDDDEWDEDDHEDDDDD